MKLKTTIYGKSSTLIGTPDEISALLDAVRRTARQRAVDRLPQVVKLDAGERVLTQVNGQDVERKSGPIPFKPTFEPIAQTREEIVKEAIADVADLLGRGYSSAHTPEIVEHVGTVILFNLDDRIDFFINKNKRVVVAKVWIHASSGTASDNSYATTGIARCAPSDVFNEYVGKAIALRRALGLPVPAKYYEVGGMLPEGKQVGDIVDLRDVFGVPQECRVTEGNSVRVYSGQVGINTLSAKNAKVIDDSARYVAPSTPAAKVVYVD